MINYFFEFSARLKRVLKRFQRQTEIDGFMGGITGGLYKSSVKY